jgi:hypothetical protein
MGLYRPATKEPIMEIVSLTIGITGTVIGIAAFIATCIIARRQEKLQRQLVKDQEENAKRQQRDQQKLEICRQLFALLSAYYTALRNATTSQDFERLEDDWVDIETLITIKLRLENPQVNKQYSFSETLRQLDYLDSRSNMCTTIAREAQSFQNTAKFFKWGVSTPRIITSSRGHLQLTDTFTNDYGKQLEQQRLEQAEVMRSAYKSVMEKLGKVIAS